MFWHYRETFARRAGNQRQRKAAELIIRQSQLRLYYRTNIAASIDRAGVRPFSLHNQLEIMNSIDAHKDELERLLMNLSHETVVSGMAFVTLLDVYIGRLDTNCSDSAHSLIRHNRKSVENQHGTNIDSELRAILRSTYNCKGSRCILSKFSQRSSRIRFIHSMADHTLRTRVRGWR